MHSAELIADLQKILTEHVAGSVQDGKIPGAAFVVAGRDGGISQSVAAGFSIPGSNTPFTTDTVCSIASMTKLVTSVAAMQLVDRGVVGLEDDLGLSIPELCNRDILKGFTEDGRPLFEKHTKALALSHLLSHTSGFGYDIVDPDLIRWRKWKDEKPTSNLFSPEMLDLPLRFQPGGGWMYGVGIDWAGRVVEILSGKSLEEYMQANIFEPLSMNDTTFHITERPDLQPRRAPLAGKDLANGLYSSLPDFKPDITAMDCGGVGLHSTAADYAKLLISLLNNDGRILKPETVDTLFTWQIPNPQVAEEQLFAEMKHIFVPEYPAGTPASYGLCGAINRSNLPGRRRKGSRMWHGLANGRWWVDREAGIAAALFVSILPPGDAEVSELYKQLEEAVYRHLDTGR